MISNSEGFPLTSIFPAPKSSSHKKDLNRNKSHEDSSYEEVVDPTTISYVKSRKFKRVCSQSLLCDTS